MTQLRLTPAGSARALAGAGFAALALGAAPAAAHVAPPLGTPSTYGVVSRTFTNSNTSPQTILSGDVWFTTGPTTPPLTATGTGGALPPPPAGAGALPTPTPSEWAMVLLTLLLATAGLAAMRTRAR